MTPAMAQPETGNSQVAAAVNSVTTAANANSSTNDASSSNHGNPPPPPPTTTTNNNPVATSYPSVTIATPPTPPISDAARLRRSNLQAEMDASRSSHSRPRRRSSAFSYSSLEDATTSFADDFISPRTNNIRRHKDDEDVTHWHSTPLAFAILPAVGGLLFQNGSLFVTDILLLGLAAIFLNWSIRLPWDWYYSAQALRREYPDVEEEDVAVQDAIPEEDEDDIAVETASSVGGSPRPHSRRVRSDDNGNADEATRARRAKAAESLRQQELLALVATFVFPMLAAYLLHVIRAQLSRPSTNLVSDYNLSIFLLAAEIRPCRQVIRLMSSRTLHLQKIVAGGPPSAGSSKESQELQADIIARLAELEDRLEANTLVPSTVSIAQKADVSDLSSDLRKRYEPRLEGLERAVRRYEKRSMTLAMAVDNRLQLLETRLQEALSLTAAVAAQTSQQNGGVLGRVGTSLSQVALAPVKIMIWSAALPFQLIDDIYVRFKNVMLGPMPAKAAANGFSKKRGGVASDKEKSANTSSTNGGSLREKVLTRKMVR